jgi:hypothetical protein
MIEFTDEQIREAQEPVGEPTWTLDAPAECECRSGDGDDVHAHLRFRYPNGAMRITFLTAGTAWQP